MAQGVLMATYDADGALEILGAYAEQRSPSDSGSAKVEAVNELLRQLAALDGRMLDLAAGPDPRFRGFTVAVSLSFGGARVNYSASQNKFIAFVDDEIKVAAPLRFNRARGIFEGEEVDTSRWPIPGDPKERRRDALVVLVETVVQAMKKAE
jgi:hypothetical protein